MIYVVTVKTFSESVHLAVSWAPTTFCSLHFYLLVPHLPIGTADKAANKCISLLVEGNFQEGEAEAKTPVALMGEVVLR